MSTQQPPGGAPEGGYTQPQDPWAGGYEPGIASVPTDPIPQQYDPYSSVPPGEVWSQPTVAQGGPYGYVPQPPRRRTGAIIAVSVLVLAVAGGAGYLAYRYTLPTTGSTGQGPSSSPGQSSPADQTPTDSSPTRPKFDPHVAKEGDCVFNFGTPKVPELGYVDCTTPKSYKIVRIATGSDIPEGPDGRFNDTVTSVQVCQGITYQTWYGYQDAVTDTRDVFFCMTNNP